MEMFDVSGGVTDLVGMIKTVPLSCGSVKTEATEVYVSGNLPCELLLGRPWQRGNLVSIDERQEGTYLVFKDLKTSKPRYEIFVKPVDRLKEPFKPIKNVRVYAATKPIKSEMLTRSKRREINVEQTTDPRNQITVFRGNKPLTATINIASNQNVIKFLLDLLKFHTNRKCLQTFADLDGNH